MGGLQVDAELHRFVTREQDRLVGMLALYTGDRWTAEELGQDAIIRLCQHWPRVRDMDHQRAWLHRVAINLANSWFRRRSAERRALERSGPAREALDEDPTMAVSLRALVATLPARQRTALVLRHYVGMNVAETATLMRCAEGTVKALTHQAIRALTASGLDGLTADKGDPRGHNVNLGGSRDA